MPTRKEINDKHKQDILDAFNHRECKIIGDVINKQTHIKYLCKCGREKTSMYKDFIRRNCRWCRDKQLKETKKYDIIDESSEIWKPIKGGYISNLGNAKNNNGVL